MTNPYTKLFTEPGTLSFSIAGLIARMPLSMMGIGIITMLSQTTGSYWLAGGVAATFTFSMALIAPKISQAVDRFGQRRVLPSTTIVSVSATCLLLVCTYNNAPVWTLFVFAALSGCMPSMPAMIRARWTEIYRNTPKLRTAYAFESVIDEMCFIIGPPIAVSLSVVAFPQAGPLISAIFLSVGVFALVLQKTTEPMISQSTKNSDSALRSPIMKVLLLALIFLGMIVGTIDVISVAFAKQAGQPATASIVLSSYALGSCLSGLIFGTLTIKFSLARQFLFASLATALMTLPLLFVTHVWALSVIVFLAGIFFAPTMIVAMSIVETIVPAKKLTEGLTWMITGLGIGIAIGAAIVGWLIDAHNIRTGLLVAIFSGLFILLIAIFHHGLYEREP